MSNLEAKIAWYEEAIRFRNSGKFPASGFVFPDGSPSSWDAVLNDLKDILRYEVWSY